MTNPNTTTLGMASLGGTPRLTLHIEADSFAELLDALDQVMGGLTPGLYAAHADEDDDGHAHAQVNVYSTPDEAKAAQAAAPKRRGRPPKADVGQPVAPAAPEAPASALAPAPATELPPAGDTTTAPAPASAATMTTLSPADARKKGIELITAHFAQHPEVLPQVQAISLKYGVGQFADISDDKAHAFLADITLLTNGTAQV